MNVKKLQRQVDYSYDKLFFSKAILVFLNIWMFSQLSPTYEKLWAKNKIPNWISPILVGQEYAKYKNNTGNFFESALGVQTIDALLEGVKNAKIFGNLFNWNVFLGIIPPIAGTYLELNGHNCDFLDILAYWSGYIYSLTSGVLIERKIKKDLISKTKQKLLQKNNQNPAFCLSEISQMQKTVKKLIEKEGSENSIILQEYLVILDLLDILENSFYEN